MRSGLGGGGEIEALASGCEPFAVSDCDPFALSGKEEAEVEASWLEARGKSGDQRSWLLRSTMLPLLLLVEAKKKIQGWHAADR